MENKANEGRLKEWGSFGLEIRRLKRKHAMHSYVLKDFDKGHNRQLFSTFTGDRT